MFISNLVVGAEFASCEEPELEIEETLPIEESVMLDVIAKHRASGRRIFLVFNWGACNLLELYKTKPEYDYCVEVQEGCELEALSPEYEHSFGGKVKGILLADPQEEYVNGPWKVWKMGKIIHLQPN